MNAYYKKKLKVFIVADSLAMPNFVDKKYEDTWIYRLKGYFNNFDIITFLKRGATTNLLVSMGKKLEYGMPEGADCLEMWMPDIVIIQLGIVDCAPRLFKPSSLEYQLINRLPFKIFQKPYINIIKKIRKRSYMRAYVSLEKYEKNLMNYFSRCVKNKVAKVIYIGIPYPDSKMIQKNPEILSAVEAYDNKCKEICDKFDTIKVIYPLDARKYNYEIYNDGYHPNIAGHSLVFDALKQELSEYKTN